MFPILIIAIGIAVLLFGNRLAVLGAAVGALLGIGLLNLFPGSTTPLTLLLVPGSLAVLGGVFAGFAKGIVNIVVMVLGALAGAAITLGFLDLFGIDLGLVNWLFAVLGGVIGLVVIRRFENWAIIILAGFVGGLLITHGLTTWMPFLEGAVGSLFVIVLAIIGIAYQGGSKK